MNIVPTIRGGNIVKSHTDYPITNKRWKLMNNGLGLWDYLNTLQLMESKYGLTASMLMNFAGISAFYLRERDNSWEFDLDPWGRKFVVLPPEKQTYTTVYRYYSYSSVSLNLNVDVIVTTVNKDRVYCVDLTKLL